MLQGRRGFSDVARLLRAPEAAVARQIVAASRAALVAPTIFAGLRRVTTTFLYDDPEHPERVTSSFQSPAYTPADQALLVGLETFEHLADSHGRCVCGQPRELAWHSEMDGWFEGRSYVCHACTARTKDGKQVSHTIVVDTREPGHPPLPPFVLGVTTSSP